jgi:hypothetical protein
MKKTLILFFLLPIYLFGNFSALNNGARSLGMGNTFVALSDDASAVFYNPAGLGRVHKLSSIASYQNMYGIKGLHNSMLSVSIPTPIIRMGLSFQNLSLDNIYDESIFYLSAASIIRPNNVPIRFGASVKIEAVSVNYLSNSQNLSNIDLDFGALVDLNKFTYLGYSLKNLLEPVFKFNSHSAKIKRRHILGICHRWRESVNFLADFNVSNEGTYWNFGSEIWFHNVFASRIGVMDQKLTIGFGLKSDLWSLDTAVLSHEELGSTYRFSFGINI